MLLEGWKNTDVLALLGLKDEFKDVPFHFDTGKLLCCCVA